MISIFYPAFINFSEFIAIKHTLITYLFINLDPYRKFSFSSVLTCLYLVVFAEVFSYLVKALYNVVYTQSLVYISLKFSEEERSAWKPKRAQVKIIVELSSFILGGKSDDGK